MRTTGGRIFILLVISNGLFLLLFAALAFHNRIATDDFHFLSLYKAYGIIEATRVEHATWTARWTSVPLTQTVLAFHDHRYHLFLYGIAVLLLFIVAVYRIIDQLALSVGWFLKLNFALFITSAFFHASIGVGETWFWLCSSTTYLVSVIMLLLGIGAILSQRRGFLDPVLCAVAFLYVGGSCEPLALFVLVSLGVAILFGRVKRTFPMHKLVISFTACIIAFTILYLGQGNRVREEFFQDIGILQAAVLNVKVTGMIMLWKIHPILPVVLLYGLPMYTVARLGSMHMLRRPVVVQRIALISLSFFSAIYIYQFPVTYVTQDIAPDRALFAVSVLAVIASVWVFHTLGRAGLGRPVHARVLAMISIVAVLLFNAFTLIAQLELLPRYAAAYDHRIEYLESMKDASGIIMVEPLPPSGLLHTAEISPDPEHFTNRHIRAGLGLQADVVLDVPSP